MEKFSSPRTTTTHFNVNGESSVFSIFTSFSLSLSLSTISSPFFRSPNIEWNMFGGDSNNPVFPVFLDQSRIEYHTNALPQLQLFGNYQVACSVDHLNYLGNEHTTSMNRPIKRGRETEPFAKDQKLHMSLNNNIIQDIGGQSRNIMNLNPVLTGLRLSYEDEEPKSSVTSAGESTSVLPALFASSSNLSAEILRQQQEFDHFIRVQEETTIKGIMEMKQRHATTFLNTIEKGIRRKLLEKDLEIENINNKNKELMERIKQINLEVQSWHHQSKYNESLVNALKINLNQALTQGAAAASVQGKEGFGDSEEDDAASYTNHPNLGGGGSRSAVLCRACKGKEVNVLFLPCRHLCLCVECERLINVCPVCSVMKTASVQVLMS